MKNILRFVWEVIKFGLLLVLAVYVLYVFILVLYNATTAPTNPPAGWTIFP